MQNPSSGTADAIADAQASRFADLPATQSHGPLRIEYRWVNEAASGAPIAVFLHEGLGSIAMWRDWPQALCERLGMRGLVYSRPGYGLSTPRPPEVEWPVDYLAVQAREILPELLDSLDIDMSTRKHMWVIGHSDGGSIALLYAARHPDSLAGAVVIAPHVFVEDISVQGIAQTVQLYETTDLRDKLARYHADVDSAFYGWSDIWLSPEFRSWTIDTELSSIRRPLLAIQGHDDHYGTMAQIDRIAARVEHTYLVKLDACGHSPHRDAPDRLNDEIATFISSRR